MDKIKSIIFSIIACIGLISNAQIASGVNASAHKGITKTLNLSKPGSLLSNISPSELEDVESLTITGFMNKADANVLTDLGKNISYLNLYGCHIIGSEEGNTAQECVIPQGFMRNRPKLKEIVFPKDLKSIEFFAFQNCTSLEEIVLPKSLKRFYDGLYAGDDATPFSGCSGLKKLIFCGSVLNYNTLLSGNLATSLKEIRFPATTGRGPGFHGIGNPRLSGIPATISNAVVYIPSPMSGFIGDFDNCEIFFESTTAPKDSRINLRNCTIHCPKGSTTSYYNAFGKNQNYIESDYPQPVVKAVNNSAKFSTQKRTPTISLSFSLFQKLIDKSSTEVLNYLKQLGCVFKYQDGIYNASVKGGHILVYPNNYSRPRLGVGPVVFSTNDRKNCNLWRNSLDKAGYVDFAGNGLWNKERNVYGCPTFGIADWLDISEDEGYDYAGSCYLYVSSYYEE